MKPTLVRAVAATFAAVALCCPRVQAGPSVDDMGFVRALPEQIEWKTGEGGVRQAVLFGDPGKPGLYVVRNIFPPGIMSTPHSHSQDRFVTVIDGTWYTGTDDRWDVASTRGLGPGSYMVHPAGAVHFDGARDKETTVQIVGMGPVTTRQVYPAEGHMGRPHLMK